MSLSRRNFLKLSAGSAVLASSSSAFSETAEATVIPKRKFGRHDDMLTVVGIGGHTLYMSGSQKEANEITARAIDLGINFFDNAWGYHGGEAEEYMGVALEGRRDQVFLMSKFPNFNEGGANATSAVAMKQLEDSLRRLKTDHLDLWMMHNVQANGAEQAYKKEGAIEALELAKQQGKIRYTGFTGHTVPEVHSEMITKGYEWDAMLMPVSIVGALRSREFEEQVMPLCAEKQIAVLGMKGFGGSRRTQLHSRTNAQEVLQYSLSYPEVCTHLIGIDKLDYVDQAVAGTSARPWTLNERTKYAKVDTSPDSPDFAAMQHGGKFYEAGCCGSRRYS
ncbi:MAG: aldo/keto reductase [Verrucomicrobiota bacterium]